MKMKLILMLIIKFDDEFKFKLFFRINNNI